MPNAEGPIGRSGVVAALALCATLVALAGCGGTGPGNGAGSAGGTPGTVATGTAGPGTGSPVDGAVVIVADSIPDGRAISGDGANPEYTFRSLWKRAVPGALAWRPDAFLVSASGDFVNNDGVPSEWMMVFRTRATGAKDLRVWIDPWGKVTRTQETAPDDTYGTRAVMPNIIDSDEAVAAALPALAERVAPATTKDPRLGLGFKDGAGPQWYYTAFATTDAAYVTATIDALTGKVVKVE
jgi:hypothetical protein